MSKPLHQFKWFCLHSRDNWISTEMVFIVNSFLSIKKRLKILTHFQLIWFTNDSFNRYLVFNQKLVSETYQSWIVTHFESHWYRNNRLKWTSILRYHCWDPLVTTNSSYICCHAFRWSTPGSLCCPSSSLRPLLTIGETIVARIRSEQVFSLYRCVVPKCDSNRLNPQYFEPYLVFSIPKLLRSDHSLDSCNRFSLINDSITGTDAKDCDINWFTNRTESCDQFIFDKRLFSSTVVTEVCVQHLIIIKTDPLNCSSIKSATSRGNLRYVSRCSTSEFCPELLFSVF